VQRQCNETAFRQLRRSTRSTLQRIICLIYEAPEFAALPGGQALAEELAGRIRASAELADSFHAVTQPHGGISVRLRTLGRSVVRLCGARRQLIDVRVRASLDCGGRFADTLMQIAHELIINAMQHGLRGLRTGTIEISLDHDHNGIVTLAVVDTGRGCAAHCARDEGLRLVEDLAAVYGGQVLLPDVGQPAKVQVRFPAAALIELGND
jgi:two-component sensor histidine kinase